MADKVLNVRIKSLYKSWAAWQAIENEFVPLNGEICLVAIPASTGEVASEPAIMAKIGNGTDVFADLPWMSATSADVHTWAKKENLEFNDLSEDFKSALSSYVGAGNEYRINKVGEVYTLQVRTYDPEHSAWGAWTDASGSSIDVSNKTDRSVTGTNGKALIFNETDGGGAKFEHSDGTWSFVGVNDGGKNGLTGQIYSVDHNNENLGTRLNMSNDGFYYTKGKKNAGYTADDELATKGDVAGAVGDAVADLDVAELSVGASETIAAISETDGKIAVTKQNIQIAESQVTNLTADLNKKVNRQEDGSNGKALIFNETDGGGAKFEHKDGTWSFMGVNDGGKDGLAGQIYAVDKDSKLGTRINVTKGGIYYTNGNTSYTYTANDEIATKGDVSEAIAGLGSALHYIGMVTLADGETEQQALARAVAAYQVTHPEYVLTAGAVAIVGESEFNKEFIYSGSEWQEFGNEGIYETKTEAQASHQALENAISAEESARIAADAKKVDKEINGANGKAIIFNEADGGGAKFEHNDGTESFVGVNDGGEDGLAAQIYADKLVDGKWQGAKLDVTNSGMYYTVGNKSFAERAVAANEIATKGDISAVTSSLADIAYTGNVNDLIQTSGDVLVLDCNV